MKLQDERTWVHVMFSTEHEARLITDANEQMIHRYMSSLLKASECTPEEINGMPDHVHVLFEVHGEVRVQRLIEHLKESSSSWINEKGIAEATFNWQKGFGAFGVHERDLRSLKAYIRNQKMVHQKLTFREEYMSYLRLNLI